MTQHINRISNIAALEAVNGQPREGTLAKKIPNLEKHAIAFIERCPFAVMATSSSDGTDASPRGDRPGFIKVLDDKTLLIPERPGNRLADSLRNIIANPSVGLLMMIPGMNETLRVNGEAFVTDHKPYLSLLAEAGKLPKLAIVLEISELYFHCPKAYIRSNLWDPSRHMPRTELPSLGKIILEQVSGITVSDPETAALDAVLDQDAQNNLY